MVKVSCELSEKRRMRRRENYRILKERRLERMRRRSEFRRMVADRRGEI